MSSGKDLSVAILTKEWPPAIYGGAGVHVSNLVSALNATGIFKCQVSCFGAPRNDASAYELHEPLTKINPALQTLLIDSDMAMNLKDVSLVHSHTWYANFAGYLASKIYSIPHVVTAHSLEPLRPWKAEQLGGGYVISSWVEKTAYESASAIISVSDGMRADIINAYPEVDPSKIITIRNGIDTEKFKPTNNANVLKKYGVSGPFAIFVGRITRQKGLAHLLRAWKLVDPRFAIVIAAGSADEPVIGAEVEQLITELQKSRSNVFWIKEMLPHDELVALLTAAQVFACPSIYEPLGIVNLEAMACETAVVATSVGGIPEVVADGETGYLVKLNQDSSQFEAEFAGALNKVLSDESLAQKLGAAGRSRVVAEFGWDKVARTTIDLYRSLI
jgi:starch synthase